MYLTFHVNGPSQWASCTAHEPAFVEAFGTGFHDCPRQWRPVTRKFAAFLHGNRRSLLRASKLENRRSTILTHGSKYCADDIEWNTIVGIERSNAGSLGVFFIELPNKRAVVLKFQNPCPEMYGNLFRRKCGVRTPWMRMVTRGGKLGMTIFQPLSGTSCARCTYILAGQNYQLCRKLEE